MLADFFDREAPDRVVLCALADQDGNVTATWRQLADAGWRLPSLTTFRRRVSQLIAFHPVPPLRPYGARCGPAGSNLAVPGRLGASQGDVLVIAIDVGDRDVIRSWVIPRPSRSDSTIAAGVREALALRSHLMLDLSEFAAHGRVRRGRP